MKKCKWHVPIIVIAIILLFALSLFFVNVRYIQDGEAFDDYKPDTWFNEYNVVFDWEVHKLNRGMHYTEIFEAIGKPNFTQGNHFGYLCFSGRYLFVGNTGTYIFVSEDEVWDKPVVDRGRIALDSLIISTALAFCGFIIVKFLKKKAASLSTKEVVLEITAKQEDTQQVDKCTEGAAFCESCKNELADEIYLGLYDRTGDDSAS